MRPPFQFTGDWKTDWLIFIASALFCLYWLRALRLAREGARQFLRSLVLAVCVFVGGRIVLSNVAFRDPHGPSVISAFVALCVFARKNRQRSRHIPAAVKRAVVARDLKGDRYDGRKHHLDHIWAFASWGSNTTDNLRVIDKQKNLKKGAKRPGFWEVW